MEAPIRVCVIGLVHDSVWTNIRSALKLSYVKFVGVADPDDDLRERFQKETGCADDALFMDPTEMLEAVETDAILSGVPNDEHAPLTEFCARHHLGLFLERPMASSLDQADLMMTAVQRSQIPFMVHFPSLWNPAVHEAARLVKSGAIGHLYQVRFSVGHRPPDEMGASRMFMNWLYDPDRNGAGAFLHLCSEGAQLCAWLLGKPMSALGVAATLSRRDLRVYDNGILIMKYMDAFAIAEGSWTEGGSLPGHGPFFKGTQGAIAVIGENVQLMNDEHPDGRLLTPEPMPAGHANGVEYFFWNLLNDRWVEAPCNLSTSRDAQEILEAGLRSVETGVECPLPVR